MSAPQVPGEGPLVLVVGAGPVGVTAAVMLADRGVRVLVVDRHADFYPLPRAVHVDDEIRRVLQGLAPDVPMDPLFMPTGGLRLLDAKHRTMAEFSRSRPVGEHGHPQANMFDQPELEAWLRERLATRPSAVLAGGYELVGLEQDAAGVRAALREPSGDVVTVEAAAVLGCDGANSTVRDLIGARLADLRFTERWLVVDVRSPHPLDAWLGVHQVCDPRRAATFMQVRDGRYRFEFRLRDGETADELMAPGRLAELVRPWTKDLPFGDLELLRSAEYTFKARVADRWRDRRVFLLGDAAHLTPPFIGQGLCAGVRDAANLTWKLADVLHGRLAEGVLDSYQAERVPPATALVRKAVLVGRVMTGGQDAAAVVRKVALTALCRVPGFGTAVLDAPPPPLPAGDLVLRRRADGRRARPGHLLPQPAVVADGRRVPLDGLLGAGPAVLTLDAPSDDLVRAAMDLGARVVRVLPAGAVPSGGPGRPGVAEVVDVDGGLGRWFAAARAASVAVRPDRVVLAQHGARDGGRALAARLDAWRRRHAAVPAAGLRQDVAPLG